jgi:rhamnosyltransferase
MQITSREPRFGVFIPTRNAGGHAARLAAAIQSQSHRPEVIWVADSESEDGSVDHFGAIGAQVIHIAKEEFDHGGTRQRCFELMPDVEVVLFLTQDAIPADSQAFGLILAAFVDSEVGVAYGRQLPRPGAGIFEAHAREFNYPARSYSVSLDTAPSLGAKAAFCSNSFAAYRAKALAAVGGFPSPVLFAEDQIAAAKLLMAGWRIAYVADARVYHSHSYDLVGEFRRYFDVGAHHARNPWLLERFGTVSGEGFRFAVSELRAATKRSPHLIPVSLLRTAVKYLSYRIGTAEHRLSRTVKQKLSYNTRYWQ